MTSRFVLISLILIQVVGCSTGAKQRAQQSASHVGIGAVVVLGGAGVAVAGAAVGGAVVAAGVLGGAAIATGGALYSTATILDAPMHIAANKSLWLPDNSEKDDTTTDPKPEEKENKKRSDGPKILNPKEKSKHPKYKSDSKGNTEIRISELEQKVKNHEKYTSEMKALSEELTNCIPSKVNSIEDFTKKISDLFSDEVSKCLDRYNGDVERLAKEIR